jgi:hypothetical protein
MSSATPGIAQENWTSPLQIRKDSGSDPVIIEPWIPNGVPDAAVRIHATQPGTYFVNLGLNVPSGAIVHSVTICYELTRSSTFITQTRVTRMNAPDAAFVLLDDATDRNSATPECYTVPAFIDPTGVLTLALRMTFLNTSDQIRISAVNLGM